MFMRKSEKIRCITVDDDFSSLSLLSNYANLNEDLELLGQYASVENALEAVAEFKPDLIFADILMPGMTGFGLISQISKNIQVVLVSGSREFAAKAYDFSVLDYIVKPISLERFNQAVAKYKKYHQADSKDSDQSSKAIYVTENYKTVKILKKEIYYLESYKEYVNIFLKSEVIKTKARLHYFEKLLKPDFIRIHRSYIIAKNKIIFYTATEAKTEIKTLPVGRTYREEFKNQMQSYTK